MNVEERLKRLYEKKENAKQATDNQDEDFRKRGLAFMNDTVIPAVRSLEGPFQKFGREVSVANSLGRDGAPAAHILIKKGPGAKNGSEAELDCLISSRNGTPVINTTFRDRKDGCKYISEGFFRSGVQDYKVESITKDEIVDKLMSEYEMYNGVLG
jgi:hypothetical protein